MADCALFQGRFQPVTIGHAATLAAILQKWNRVIIGVVYNSLRPLGIDARLNNYLNLVEKESYGPGRNPFLPAEIKEMWDAYIVHERLEACVVSKLVKRMEFELELDTVFPPQTIDMVWPELSSDDSGTDVWRHKLYPRVFKRAIHYVRPTMKLHNSRICTLVQPGVRGWEKFIPPGAHEVFLRIREPLRMEAVAKLRNL